MTTVPPSRAPSTRGFLSTCSLGELLVLALEQRLHGSFVFETPLGQKGALMIDGGYVLKARAAQAVEPLGQLLVEDRLIDAATLESGLARAGQTAQRIGET